MSRQGKRMVLYMHIYPKKQPFNSNIYNRSTQKCPDTFKSTYKELSKWGVCIIYVLALYTLHYICLKNCNICLKNYSRYEIEFSYVVRHLQKQPTNSGRVTDLKNLLLLFELSCFFFTIVIYCDAKHFGEFIELCNIYC